MNRKWFLMSALVAGSAASVYAEEPSYSDLKQQVDQLRSRLDQLEQKSLSTADVNATVERVIHDANDRSKLLAADGSITAGWDHGFYIKSEDGNYVLRPGVWAQFRNVTNYRSDDGGDLQNGFEFRRLRLRMEGNAFTPDFAYMFVWDANRSGGSVNLLDALFAYRFAPEWVIRGGQYRESWVHEGDVNDMSQLAVERSLIDSVIGGSVVDRVQGVSLMYGGTKENPLRVEGTFHDGANSKNSDFRDTTPGTNGAAPTFDEDFGFGGRVEYKFAGRWSDYRDFTAKGTSETLLVAGGGFDFTQRGDVDVTLATVDLQYENEYGFNAYGALHAAITNTDEDDLFTWGALVQAGYLFTPQWEVFGRYDIVHFDDDAGTAHDAYNEIAVGVNYYLGKDGSALHRGKFTFDVVYLPDGVPENETGIGALAGEDDQILLRGQFTLQI